MVHARVGGAGSASSFPTSALMYQPARRLFVALSLVLATVFAADFSTVGAAQAQAPFFTMQNAIQGECTGIRVQITNQVVIVKAVKRSLELNGFHVV